MKLVYKSLNLYVEFSPKSKFSVFFNLQLRVAVDDKGYVVITSIIPQHGPRDGPTKWGKTDWQIEVKI